jgi:hypothetical protein
MCGNCTFIAYSCSKSFRACWRCCLGLSAIDNVVENFVGTRQPTRGNVCSGTKQTTRLGVLPSAIDAKADIGPLISLLVSLSACRSSSDLPPEWTGCFELKSLGCVDDLLRPMRKSTSCLSPVTSSTLPKNSLKLRKPVPRWIPRIAGGGSIERSGSQVVSFTLSAL